MPNKKKIDKKTWYHVQFCHCRNCGTRKASFTGNKCARCGGLVDTHWDTILTYQQLNEWKIRGIIAGHFPMEHFVH